MSGMDWSLFLFRNGYGAYIWGAIGMCALVVLGECLVLRRQQRLLRQQLRQSAGSEGAQP